MRQETTEKEMEKGNEDRREEGAEGRKGKRMRRGVLEPKTKQVVQTGQDGQGDTMRSNTLKG